MNIRKEVLKLAVPAIVTNITTPLLSLADMAITGHIGDAIYIGAIAVGGTLFNSLYWLFNFLRMGTGGLAAQAFGSGKGRDTVLWRSSLLAVGFGVLLILLGTPLRDIALRFMDADGATQVLAARYFSICIWGAPAVLLTYVAMGWLVGMQNTRATMWTAIATNLINIAVSATLVFGIGWKIEGVAIGTLTAQWCGIIIAFSIIFLKYHPKRCPLSEILQKKEIKRFLSINTDIFLRTACIVAVTLWFTHVGAQTGAITLAANALLLQLFMLMSFFLDGFAYAAEALAGKYGGAGDSKSLHTLIRYLVQIGFYFAAGFAVIYSLCGKTILQLLTDNHNVVELAMTYLPWAVAMPLCGFGAFVYDGILVGLTRTRIMLTTMAAAAVVFFAFGLLLRSAMGNHALWFAFDAYLLTRSLIEAMRTRVN